jgi:hypothetical protein
MAKGLNVCKIYGLIMGYCHSLYKQLQVFTHNTSATQIRYGILMKLAFKLTNKLMQGFWPNMNHMKKFIVHRS